LWSPTIDLTLMLGLGSVAFVALGLVLSHAAQGAKTGLTNLFYHLAAVCNFPHYAASYALIVRERHARPHAFRTLLWSLIPLVMLLALGSQFGSGVRLLTTAYLVWSAHHYAAQHFGLASMYAQRDGRPLAAASKPWVRAAFLGIGAAMMLFTVDRPLGDAGLDDLRSAPYALTHGAGYVAAVLVCLASCGAMWMGVRRGSISRLVLILFGVHCVWFVIPNLRLPLHTEKGWALAHAPWTTNVSSWLVLSLAFFHCAQYLGVAAFRARMTGNVRPVYAYLGIAAVGVALFPGIIALLSRVGRVDSGGVEAWVLALLNLHHFIIDGMIWTRARTPGPG
jgi:hypothetical protein